MFKREVKMKIQSYLPSKNLDRNTIMVTQVDQSRKITIKKDNSNEIEKVDMKFREVVYQTTIRLLKLQNLMEEGEGSQLKSWLNPLL